MGKMVPCDLSFDFQGQLGSCIRENSYLLKNLPWQKPLDVRAGVPMRMPPGTIADTSPGIAFLLATI